MTQFEFGARRRIVADRNAIATVLRSETYYQYSLPRYWPVTLNRKLCLSLFIKRLLFTITVLHDQACTVTYKILHRGRLTEIMHSN